MDDILSELGIVVKDEQTAQRNVLEERIRNSILFTNDLQVPQLSDTSLIPVLSSNAIFSLFDELKVKNKNNEPNSELKSSNLENKLKIKFLQHILKLPVYASALQRDEESVIIDENASGNDEITQGNTYDEILESRRSVVKLDSQPTASDGPKIFRTKKKTPDNHNNKTLNRNPNFDLDEECSLIQFEAINALAEPSFNNLRRKSARLASMGKGSRMESYTSSLENSYSRRKPDQDSLEGQSQSRSTLNHDNSDREEVDKEDDDETEGSDNGGQRRIKKTRLISSSARSRRVSPRLSNKIKHKYSDEDDSEDAGDVDCDSETTHYSSAKQQRDGDVQGQLSDDWDDEEFYNRFTSLAADSYVQSDFGKEVYHNTWTELHPYQRAGVSWMFKLFDDGTGGILADEMGLGKTAQVCCHLDTVGRHISTAISATEELPRFLVVCPATLLDHWLREVRRWAPCLRAVLLHRVSVAFQALEDAKYDMAMLLKDLFTNRIEGCVGVVAITSYEGLRRMRTTLVTVHWTIVCLDEGQKIRNPHSDITLISKIVSAQHRIILSGTPIQNSLKELWSLFDFVCPGRLGTLSAFEREVEAPIRQGGFKSASGLQVEIAVRTASTLQRILKPYLLRRRKTGDAATSSVVLPKKTEQVLFCRLSPSQKIAYLNVINSSDVQAVLSRRLSAFRCILQLRAICNHSDLKIKTKLRNVNAKESSMSRQKTDQYDSSVYGDDEVLVDGVDSFQDLRDKSGKLLVLSKVLPLWKAEGHKVLLFSQSLGMLSLLEKLMKHLNFSYLRLDGSTTVVSRSNLISRFNTDEDLYAMLLTTKTGGVGISLTAANRVVLVDPDWNPQTDIQARERAWRLGQKREVTIFRLITRGTIEEKIYQRQIFKVLLSSRILDNPRQKQMFSKSDLKELFTLNEEDGVGEDLPSQGTVALAAHMENAESTTVRNNTETKPSVSNNDQSINATETDYSESKREKKLLKALWDGEALTGVFDHSTIEPNDNVQSSSLRAQFADRAVEESVRHLEASVSSQCPQGSNRFNRYCSTAAGGNGVQSSASLIGWLKGSSTGVGGASTLPVPSDRSDAEGAGTSTLPPTTTASSQTSHHVATPESTMVAKLKAILSPGQKFTSQQILNRFGDLDDFYAPLFRETLRTLAKFENGCWTRK